MNLKQHAMASIESPLASILGRGQDKEARQQIASDLVGIVRSAYRLGYYSAIKQVAGLEFTEEAFNETEANSQTLAGMLFRILEASA